MPRKSNVKAKENFNNNENTIEDKKIKKNQREALSSIQNLNAPNLLRSNANFSSTPIFENVIVDIHQNLDYKRRFPHICDENQEFSELTDSFEYADYTTSVLEYLGYLENFATVPEFFMATQTQIDDHMRAVLVDWLINVHRMFDLVQETLFITIQLLDRFISIRFVTSEQFQLIGITCLLIASKYEERSYPAIQNYTKVADESYTCSQIIETESMVLNSLDFDFGSSLSIQFLRRITILCRLTSAPHNLAKYFLEVCLTDGYMSQFKPSLIAASSIFLSLAVFQLFDILPQIEIVSGYKSEEMMHIINRIPKIIERNEQSKLTAVYKKYSLRGVGSVSNLPQLKMHQFKNMTYFN